jgi:hypothetical protein
MADQLLLEGEVESNLMNGCCQQSLVSWFIVVGARPCIGEWGFGTSFKFQASCLEHSVVQLGLAWVVNSPSKGLAHSKAG